MKGAEAQNRKNLPNIYSHSYKSARVLTDLTRKLLMAVYGKRVLVSPLVKESKTALDSGFQNVDSGFQVPGTGFFFSGTWIPDLNR